MSQNDMGAEQISGAQDRGLVSPASDVPQAPRPLTAADLLQPEDTGDVRLAPFADNFVLNARLFGLTREQAIRGMAEYRRSESGKRTELEHNIDRNLSMGTQVRFRRAYDSSALKLRDGSLTDADLLKFKSRFAGYNDYFDKKVDLIEELESYDRGLAVANFELYLTMWYELRQEHPTAIRRSRDLLARFNASGPAEQEQEAITILVAVDKIMDRRYKNGIKELDEVVKDRLEGEIEEKIESKRMGEPSMVDENISTLEDLEALRGRISLQIDRATVLRGEYERGSRPQRLDIVKALPGEMEKAYIESFSIYAKAWDDLNRGGGDIVAGLNQRLEGADNATKAAMSYKLRGMVLEELSKKFGRYKEMVKDAPHGVMKAKDVQGRFRESSIPGKIEFLKDLGVV